jgi:hypothetical protein
VASARCDLASAKREPEDKTAKTPRSKMAAGLLCEVVPCGKSCPSPKISEYLPPRHKDAKEENLSSLCDFVVNLLLVAVNAYVAAKSLFPLSVSWPALTGRKGVRRSMTSPTPHVHGEPGARFLAASGTTVGVTCRMVPDR